MVIFRRIKRLLSWIPIIWNDYEWDCSTSLLRIIKHKLELSEDYFSKYGHTMSSAAEAQEMRVCIRYIDHILNKKYNKSLDDYYAKYPLITWTTPNHDSKNNVISYTMHFKRYGEQAELEFQIAMEHSKLLYDEYYDQLFTFLRKSERWID